MDILDRLKVKSDPDSRDAHAEILRLRKFLARALNSTRDQVPTSEEWDVVREVQRIICAAFRGEEL